MKTIHENCVEGSAAATPSEAPETLQEVGILNRTNMKSLFCIIVCLLSLAASSTPIQGSGNYKGHGPNGNGGITIRCGWQWWHVCWGVDAGILWIDDWDHPIGTLCFPGPGADPGDPADNAYIMENMEAGSHMDENNEMETWYQFSNIVFVPN
jgi:hypothetical protein